MRGLIAERLAAAGLPPLPRNAWLELDLDALVDNLALIRGLADGAATHPVVKADAYGHGAIPIATALEAAAADGFCVATFDEAMAIREGGIRAPIRVMYPIPAAVVADAAAAGIAVTVGDLTGLRDAVAALAGRRGRDRPLLEFELEVDTGLGRGGLLPRDVEAAVVAIESSPDARLTGLWTHLQASEDPDRTAVQLERFDSVWSWAWSRPGSAGITRSVAASGGLLTGVAGLDVVRPGLTVYGIVPDELEAAPLDPAIVERFRPVMSLHAQPVRVADVVPGDGVSYGPTWRAQRPSRVATLPLGYGDGYARAHSNRGHALVRGRRAPIVGNVAMDAVLVDVTDVPGDPVTTADEFVLLGDQEGARIGVEELARQRTTNTWEVVTSMAARLPRVYHAASAPVGLRTLTERRG